jgi:carbonic anhydrase
MKKIITVSLLVATAVIVTTGCVDHNEDMEHSKTHEAHWGYKGKYSPLHWGEIKEEFAMCSKGKMQTPINIIATQDVNIKDLDFNYNTTSTNVINNGHTVQVNIASGSTVNIDGIDYELKQFHFHTPSENNINGISYPLEAHFVHSTKDGKLAVVAVMFKDGKASPILEKIWNKFPLEENKAVFIDLSSIDIKSMMPSNKDYYKFIGSLTTPPCSENVKWNVFKTPMTISKEQVKQFFEIFEHSNNRPIQNTNNRKILE